MQEYLQMFEESSDELKNIIISVGCFEVRQMKKINTMSDDEIIEHFNKDNNASIYTSKINSLRNEYEEKVNTLEQHYKEHIEKIKETSTIEQNEYQKKLKSIEHDIEIKHIKDIDNLKEIFDLKLESKEKEIESLQKDLLESCEKDRLSKIIESKFNDTTEFNNPTEQGKYAEEILDDIVNSHELEFDDKATIHDSAGYGGSGDRIITFPSNGLRLMIEVKKKGRIKPTDIEQFEDHFNKDFREDKSDIALFFSYDTTKMIGKYKSDAVTARYFTNDKVIFFGLDDKKSKVEKRERIKEELRYIYRRYNERKDTIDTSGIYNIYNVYLMRLKGDKEEYMKAIKRNKLDIEENSRKLSDIEKDLNSIHHDIIIKNISVDNTLLDNKLYKRILIERIKEWLKENNICLNECGKMWRDKLLSGMHEQLREYDLNKLGNKNYITLKDLKDN